MKDYPKLSMTDCYRYYACAILNKLNKSATSLPVSTPPIPVSRAIDNKLFQASSFLCSHIKVLAQIANMPLWLIFHPPGTYEDSSTKQAFAEDVTKMYKELNLPAFYVVVNFIKLSAEDVWIGGKQKTDKPFIRVVINHIAFHVPDSDAAYKRSTTRIDAIIKPHVTDKGYDSEFHVDETDRRLWRINGMIPPAYASKEEQMWVKEDRAIAYEGAF
jgi:hypothetical protein